MKTKRKRRKVRLYGKEQPRFPKPVSAKKDKQGFSLRTIESADSRFAVVKALRRRLDQLIKETGSVTYAKRTLAGRAVFIAQYLESAEVDALDGIAIDWKKYLSSVKALSDVLSKLGLEREVKSAVTLSEYTNCKKKKG